MPAIPELRRLRAGELQFKAKIGYTTRCYIKNEWTANKQKQNKTNKKWNRKEERLKVNLVKIYFRNIGEKPTASKILEEIIKHKIIKYLTKEKGRKKKRSTERKRAQNKLQGEKKKSTFFSFVSTLKLIEW